MLIAAGVVAGVLALALLRVAWGRKQGGRGVLIVAAWALVAASLAAWSFAGGEAGAAQGVAAFTALATGYIGFLFLRAGARAPAVAEAKPAAATAAAEGGPRAWAFALAMLAVTAVATLLSGLCFMLSLRAGAAEADAVVAAALLAPLLWAGLMLWLLMDASLARRGFGLLGLAALGAAAFALA